MRRHLTLLCLSLLLLGASAPLGAAPAWRGDSLHTGVWSVYASGGAVLARGLGIESVNAPRMTEVSPLYGAGLSVQFAPWVRMNLDYGYGSYQREQRYSSIQPFDKPQLSIPGMELKELYGGQAYYKSWTGFHDVGLSLDFNLAEIFRKGGAKRFNLYLGAGFGYTIADGNGYDISLGHELWSDPNNLSGSLQVGNSHEIYSWVDVTNTPHSYKSTYLPASLWMEYDIAPRFSIGARAMCSYVFSEEAFSPEHVYGAALTLRLNLVGKKHGYSSYKKMYAALDESHSALLSDYDKARREYHDQAAEQARRIAALEETEELLRRDLDDCETRPVPAPVAERKVETTVQFASASDRIVELEEIRLREFIRSIRSDEKVLLLVGEASSEGGAAQNQRLSERRLARVIEMLKANGVSEDRIIRSEAIGASAGIADPVARRVTITVE